MWPRTCFVSATTRNPSLQKNSPAVNTSPLWSGPCLSKPLPPAVTPVSCYRTAYSTSGSCGRPDSTMMWTIVAVFLMTIPIRIYQRGWQALPGIRTRPICCTQVQAIATNSAIRTKVTLACAFAHAPRPTLPTYGLPTQIGFLQMAPICSIPKRLWSTDPSLCKANISHSKPMPPPKMTPSLRAGMPMRAGLSPVKAANMTKRGGPLAGSSPGTIFTWVNRAGAPLKWRFATLNWI